MNKKQELKLLDKVKRQLIGQPDFIVKSGRYELSIDQLTWHKIFKTDEYNEMKNEKS